MQRFLLVLLLTACTAAPPPPPSVAPEPVAAPVDTTPQISAEWYFSFPSSDSLAGFLRAGSGARMIVSAHRGGPQPGFPENALETLERTTNGTGELAQQTLARVREYVLQDEEGHLTTFRIPTLAEALAWSEARTVLMLDIKQGVPAVRVIDAIRRARAENRVVVIVY